MKKTILVLASFFMLFGVLIFFVIAFNENFLNTFLDIDGDAAANVGSFFGGIVGAIFSLIGVLLVIYSILLINDETQKNNVREYFFKMLDYYKEDVRALSFGRFKESSPGRAEGKQAISHFRENLKENYKLVNNIIK
ncbi:MAG: hypothetical protein LBO69_06940, partial [Ignavibacteria bacterium]|nr:hypothetical protein [Ignavibacteria bacterium]